MYMKPALAAPGELFRESSVEMRLEGIALQQLTRYLYDIERAPQLLRVRRLHIKPHPANPDLLDVTFQVSTFYLQERTSEQRDKHLDQTGTDWVKLARRTTPEEDR